MSGTAPFGYPLKPHARKHGPSGYKNWDNYRDWLRDEFDFRCVFCLRREVWDERRAVFAVEHLIPRKHAPDLALDYTNLVYACSSCNSAKSANPAPDPCVHAYGKLVVVDPDGEIRPLNADGKRLIRTVCLDDEETTRWRALWIGVLHSYAKHYPDRYRAMLSFPLILPDLTKLAPPGGNAKPDGAINCWHAQQSKGPLPVTE